MCFDTPSLSCGRLSLPAPTLSFPATNSLSLGGPSLSSLSVTSHLFLSLGKHIDDCEVEEKWKSMILVPGSNSNKLKWKSMILGISDFLNFMLQVLLFYVQE
jgi:hypothetical protein